jgi:hypothetical protein
MLGESPFKGNRRWPQNGSSEGKEQESGHVVALLGGTSDARLEMERQNSG